MLSVSVCTHCRKEANRRDCSAWMEDIQLWNSWTCLKLNGAIPTRDEVTPKDNPPSACPYKLEHAVSLGMEND